MLFLRYNGVVMKIEYQNEEIEAFIKYGIAKSNPYRKWRSNEALRRNIDKVMRILMGCSKCEELKNYGQLAYEKLTFDRIGQSSVRLGYKTKYRLIFMEMESGILIRIIEISEHYGDK